MFFTETFPNDYTFLITVAISISFSGPSLDPLFVVQRMPADLVVPGLRDALAKILSDYAMQVW